MATNNSTIMAKAWLAGTNDFQQRIPNPDQATMQATIDALYDPMNRQYFNQFIDILINRIGRTIVRNKRWENKLRAFKSDNLRYGSTIQEIAPKWIKAHSYVDDAEDVFKMYRPEAQAWYHTINRQDKYPISINYDELRQAFTDEYGLNELINSIMVVPQNSDAYDEYLSMRQLIAFYENTWGFYKVHTEAITDEASGKAFLTKARALAKRLTFPSTLYNAQIEMDIPVFAEESELVLITTPEVEAALDVEALSAVFNLDKAELKYRTVIIDEFPIPNAQALLTTADWFVVHDVVYETTSIYNPATLGNNYWLHHWEIISCSPFVPAVLFTTDASTTVPVATQTVSGITLSAAKTTGVLPGEEVQLTVNLTGSISPETDGIEVAPDAATYELSASHTAGSNTTAVELNSRTYVDRLGVLHIQKTGLETGDKISVKATAAYVNPSGTTSTYTSSAVTITIA